MGASNRENYEKFGEEVGTALREAGWIPGRSADVTKWVQQLESVGYLVSPYARRVWAEFGNLNIRSLPSRVPKSSLRVDPVDAGIDTVDEAQRLGVRLQTTFAPLGTWSSQFRAYVGDRGRVVAVGPRSAWFLGDTIESALRFIVEGDGRGIARPDIEEWILLINTYKAIRAVS
jgi:SUKH-3 immunity protein